MSVILLIISSPLIGWSHSSLRRPGPRCLTVQYEKLVLDPRRVMSSVLRFLGLTWDDAVLRCEVRAGRGRLG